MAIMGRLSNVSPTILLLSLQIATRFFTFALNQVLIRFSSPALYGAAHINLELLLGIVLFLSREGIRAACLRQGDRSQPGGKENEEGQGGTQSDVEERSNLPLLPIPLGVLFAAIALPLFTSSTQTLASQPHHHTVIYLYLLSSLLELISEPLYLHALSSKGGRNLALRVRAEGSAAIAKGVVTLAGVILLGEQGGFLAFGLGQAAYGTAILLTFAGSYCRRFGLSATLLLYKPTWRSARQQEDASISTNTTAKLALLLFLQSMLKHLLTEADKIAVSRLASLEDQGGYALGTNYASLPLRLVFQPLEESSRFQFSRSLGSLRSGSISDEKDSQKSTTTTGSSHTRVKLASTYHLLSSLLHLHLFLGLLLLCYLPPLSKPFIQILSGARWASTSAPRTLASFAIFLPAAGWSGILEGFLQSTASPDELKLYNRVILASSATFGGMLWFLTRNIFVHRGLSTEEALVYASTASMAVRAFCGWRYASAFFRDGNGAQRLTLVTLLPSRATLLTVLSSAVLLRSVTWNLNATQDLKAALPLKVYGPLLLTATTTGVGALGMMWSQDRTSILHALSALRG